jgi:hypothetical protein
MMWMYYIYIYLKNKKILNLKLELATRLNQVLIFTFLHVYVIFSIFKCLRNAA